MSAFTCNAGDWEGLSEEERGVVTRAAEAIHERMQEAWLEDATYEHVKADLDEIARRHGARVSVLEFEGNVITNILLSVGA